MLRVLLDAFEKKNRWAESKEGKREVGKRGRREKGRKRKKNTFHETFLPLCRPRFPPKIQTEFFFLSLLFFFCLSAGFLLFSFFCARSAAFFRKITRKFSRHKKRFSIFCPSSFFEKNYPVHANVLRIFAFRYFLFKLKSFLPLFSTLLNPPLLSFHSCFIFNL